MLGHDHYKCNIVFERDGYQPLSRHLHACCSLAVSPPPAISSRNPFFLISLTFSFLLPSPTMPAFLASLAASSPFTCAARTALKSFTTPLCAVFLNLFS